LQKWGRYSIASDPTKADLVLVITEGHYGSITLLNGTVNNGTVTRILLFSVTYFRYIKEALPDEKSLPLWTRIERGGYTWPAKRAMNRFKKEVQEAEKK